jgi:inosose dehydratase
MLTPQFSMSLNMINRHYSEPNRNRYESRYYWEELYTLIHAAGFSAIEIPYEPVWQFGGRSGVPLNTYCINTKYKDVASYKAYLGKQGIKEVSAVTFDANLFVRNDQLGFYFGASGHFASQAIDLASQVGAKTMVLSPSAYKGRLLHYHPNLDTEDFLAKTKELLKDLAEKAKEKGVKLAIRPEYWGVIAADKIADLIRSISSDIGLAINTAHLQIAGLDPLAFIRENQDLIAYVQFSDSNETDCSAYSASANPSFPENAATQVFRDVGTGSVPLVDIYRTLASQGYAGDIAMCNHQTRDPMRALLRNRHFINQLPNPNQEI